MTAGSDAAGAAPTRTFRTGDSRTLSYRLQGTGPLVVMVPGGPGLDPAAFYASAELPGCTQLVLCPRGTGESDPPSAPEGYRIAGYVDDLEELRRHLDVEQVVLHGSSHGASVALAYAAAFPDRVEAMVLASGPARFDGAFAQALGRARKRFRDSAPDGGERLDAADAATPQMRSADSDEGRRKALRALLGIFVVRLGAVETAYLDRLCAATTNFVAPGPMAAEMIGGLDLLRGADAIRARTLVLAGELDARVPVEHLQEIAEAVPGAQLARIPDAGHLIHVDAREQWAQTVGDFLRSA